MIARDSPAYMNSESTKYHTHVISIDATPTGDMTTPCELTAHILTCWCFAFTALSFTTKIAYEAGRKHIDITTMMAVVNPSSV